VGLSIGERMIGGMARDVLQCRRTALTVFVGAVAAYGCSGTNSPSRDGERPGGQETVDSTRLVSALNRIRPTAEMGEPHATPIPGVIGLAMPGGNVVYGTVDGRYIIAGDLYALEDVLVNLTEQRRETERKVELAALDVASMVVFPAADERRHVLNAFVDVDCEYCRMMLADHEEISAYGLEVRYLAYPRAGLDSSSYGRMVSAWCAEDPRTALGTLMHGNEIPETSCENPVAEHFMLAKSLGIPGTPGIVAPDGRLLRGYVSASELVEDLVR